MTSFRELLLCSALFINLININTIYIWVIQPLEWRITCITYCDVEVQWKFMCTIKFVYVCANEKYMIAKCFHSSITFCFILKSTVKLHWISPWTEDTQKLKFLCRIELLQVMQINTSLNYFLKLVSLTDSSCEFLHTCNVFFMYVYM